MPYKQPRTVCAMVSDREHAVVRAAAHQLSMPVSAFVRRAVQRTLRGPWTEEQDMQAEYDELEITVPKGRLARFALLVPGEMERCEHDGCKHCNAFIRRVAPEFVVSTDRFRLAADGLTIEMEPR